MSVEEELKRFEEIRKEGIYDDSDDEEEEEEESISRKQIEKSLDRVSSEKTEGLNEVKKIQLEEELSEMKRIENYENSMKELKEMIQKSLNETRIMNGSIDMRWGELREEKDPERIKELLFIQKESCLSVISKMDGVAHHLKQQLRKKDQEYIGALKQQESDINEICRQMKEQLERLERCQAEEMSNIENSFEEERKQLMKKNDLELESASTKRKELERKYLEQRMKRSVEFERFLQEDINHEKEEYARVKKIKDETVQTLEANIDILRAKYELNGEKVNHYREVLKRRTKNNDIILSQLANKRIELQDQKTNIKQLYRKDDFERKQENIKKTQQYNRLAKQYKDLLKKFRYFEKADVVKYQEVWKMNEAIAKEKFEKLMLMDRIIEEKILGNRYIPPSNEFLVAQKINNNNNNNSTTQQQQGISSSSIIKNEQQQQQNQVHSSSSPSMITNKKKNEPTKKKEEILSAKELTAAKIILKELCDQTSFLIEEKVMESLSRISNPSEQSLLKLNSVLEVLGLDQAEDVDRLIQFFIENNPKEFEEMVQKITRSRSRTSASTKEEEEEEQQQQQEKNRQQQQDLKPLPISSFTEIKIPTESVISTLTSFLEEHREKQQNGGDSNNGQHVTNNKKKKKKKKKKKNPLSRHHQKSSLNAKHRRRRRRRRHTDEGTDDSEYSDSDSDSEDDEEDDEDDEDEEEDEEMRIRNRIKKERLMKKRQQREKYRSKKEREEREEREFWERITSVLPEEKLQLWKDLDQMMGHYEVTLKEREKLKKEIRTLEKTNEEMESLLSVYQNNKLNEELLVPPDF